MVSSISLDKFLSFQGLTPNRHPIIRFFISSTFTDMEEERDILHDILSSLAEEYASKGWQIESVDLRWGISRKEGLDNRTMSTCLEEIDNCRAVSPRPNFILLTGERYGWIPIPERIPENVVYSLSFSGSEQSLFHKWYFLDRNSLPEPSYFLKGRTGRFTDEKVYNEEALRPLENLFVWNSGRLRMIYGKSATAQEIFKGGFIQGEEGSVIAYSRTLHHVPKEKRSVFFDSSLESTVAQKILSRSVKKWFGGHHFIQNDLTFDEYVEGSWRENFRREFSDALRAVIGKEIEEAKKPSLEYERTEHISFAFTQSEHFTGREAELSAVRSYILDNDSRHPLWITGEEGTGKTALLSSVAASFLADRNYDTVVRFCGKTPDSSDYDSLRLSLDEEIGNISGLRMSFNQSLAPKKEGFFDFTYAESRKHSFKKPLVLILDSVDAFGKDFGEIFGELKPGVKVILSSKRGPRHPVGKIIPLGEGGFPPLDFIREGLERRGRTLTVMQFGMVERQLVSVPRPALYYDLLCDYLSSFTSEDDIPLLPEDTPSLVKAILERAIRKDSAHGYGLLPTILLCIHLDREGLTEKEILSIISSDDGDYALVMSGHTVQKNHDDPFLREIPPIVWARMRRMVSPLLRLVQKGQRLSFKMLSTPISNIVYNALSDKETLLSVTERLYSFHRLGVGKHSPHSIVESQYSAVLYLIAYRNVHGVGEDYIRLRDKVIRESFSDPSFLVEKLALDRKDLLRMSDYLCSGLLRHDTDERAALWMERLSSLKKTFSLLRSSSPEALRAEIKNLPSDNILRKLAFTGNVPSENLLSDVLLWEDSIVETADVESIGSGAISSDGKNILYLENDGTFDVCRFYGPSGREPIYFSSPVSKVVASDDLGTVIAYDDCGYKSDIVICMGGKRGAIKGRIPQKVDLSSDGTRYAVWEEGTVSVYEGFKGVRSTGCSSPGCMTEDGKYLWYIDGESLFRMEVSTGRRLIIDRVSYGEGNLLSITAGFVRVASGSEHICLISYHTGLAVSSSYGGCGVILGEDGMAHFFPVDVKLDFGIDNYPWSNYDESSIIIRNPNSQLVVYSADKTEVKIRLTDILYAPELVDLSGDFSYALTKDGNILDMKSFLKSVYLKNMTNAGINSFASSRDGRNLILSIGKERGLEYYPFVLTLSSPEKGCQTRKTVPPFEGSVDYFARAVIAPDSSFALLSTFGNDCQILKCSPDCQRKEGIARTGSVCTALAISSDNRYLLGATGSYFLPFHEKDLNHKNRIYLFNADCSPIREMELDSDEVGDVREDIRFTPDNRYAIWNGCVIIDLLSGEATNTADSLNMAGVSFDWGCTGRYSVADEDSPLLRISSFLHPDGKTLFYNYVKDPMGFDQLMMVRLSIPDGKKEEWPTEYRIIGISPSGKVFLFLDGEDSLLVSSSADGPFRKLSSEVKYAILTLDERYIYAAGKDGILRLVSLEGMNIPLSYIGESYDMSICGKGLYATNREGRLFFFEADKAFGINDFAWATFTFHYDLEKGQRESSPSAVCPHCGAVIRNDKWVEEIKNGGDTPSQIEGMCPHCQGRVLFTPFFG